MAETFLVLGSNSFSGATMVASLLQTGETVIGISRSPQPHACFLPYRWTDSGAGKFSFHQLDLNGDLDAIMDVVNAARPAYVVNFAAQSMVAQSWENPDHWFMTNVVSTVRFHERLRRCEFLKKYVHVTTPEVYGSSTGGAVKEDAAFNPSTPYAVSRAAADMSLRAYFNAYEFPVVFTRAANVYGPGQQLYRIVPRTAFFIKLGRKLQLDGGGRSTRSFIHARDVAEATLRAARDGRDLPYLHRKDRFHPRARGDDLPADGRLLRRQRRGRRRPAGEGCGLPARQRENPIRAELGRQHFSRARN
jgi:dTDP-glucose 4,6-dehydratase